MNKLVVVIMGQNCEKFIGMCLESVKDADAIVYCDGGSTDNTINISRSYCAKVIQNPYDQQDKQMNGKQRNFYLDYIKKNFPGWFCLCLDADEVLSDGGVEKIKEFLTNGKVRVWSVHMDHFIGDLGHIDATREKHWVPRRLFKITDDLKYPLDSHPVLTGYFKEEGGCDCVKIFHLGHLPVEYMKYISKRYSEHLYNSTIHTKEFLKSWKEAHLYGRYPKSEIDLTEIPKVILDNFGIDFDELYFRERGLEIKHFIDAGHWRDFFKCKNAIELGCGRGPRILAMNTIGIDTHGIELSEFAVKNKMHHKIIQGDILDEPKSGNYDLSIAYDLLEHLNYKDLDKSIDNLIHYSNKHILVSVPYKGTKNCDADPTHKIKEDRDWWLDKFISKGLKEVEVPSHFICYKQLLIFEK